MNEKQYAELFATSMAKPKKEIVGAFLHSLDIITALTCVLETYIGTNNVLRISVAPDDEDFLATMMKDGGAK